MIEFTICLMFLLAGLSIGLLLKKTRIEGVEIEDDGETALVYIQAPGHVGELKTALIKDGDNLKIFTEREII